MKIAINEGQIHLIGQENSGEKITRQTYDVPAQCEVLISECFTGIGLLTDCGHFGICQRDGGIEIMLGGKMIASITKDGLWVPK